MSANSLMKQRPKRGDKPMSLAVGSTLEKLETRRLFSTVYVGATSCGSWGGADVSDVVIYDDANDNGVLDYGENSTSLTPSPGDDTIANGSLDIYDDGHTVHLRAQVPSNEYEWGGNNSIDFTADGTEDGNTYSAFPIGPVTSVSGKVFEDFNGNGAQDTDDSSLSGWTVYIDTNGNGSYDSGEPTTTTESNGNYTLVGDYMGQSVRVVPINSSWSLDYPGASCDGGGHLISSATETGDNFGVQGPITITGTVWTDSNDNGVRDSGESATSGNSSWTVFDDVNKNGQLDSGEPTTTVLSNGTYSLDTEGAATLQGTNST